MLKDVEELARSDVDVAVVRLEKTDVEFSPGAVVVVKLLPSHEEETLSETGDVGMTFVMENVSESLEADQEETLSTGGWVFVVGVL